MIARLKTQENRLGSRWILFDLLTYYLNSSTPTVTTMPAIFILDCMTYVIMGLDT
jgi:hypothetical protein